MLRFFKGLLGGKKVKEPVVEAPYKVEAPVVETVPTSTLTVDGHGDVHETPIKPKAEKKTAIKKAPAKPKAEKKPAAMKTSKKPRAKKEAK